MQRETISSKQVKKKIPEKNFRFGKTGPSKYWNCNLKEIDEKDKKLYDNIEQAISRVF